jgi:tripartite-type tricarboxylate transporter receptor subunit TctC
MNAQMLGLQVMLSRLTLVTLVTLVTLLAPLGTLAQTPPTSERLSWPERAVHIVVPFAPGGGTDYVARITAKKLADQYGQPFLVENKPGAGGTTGSDLVVKSKPDGYTWAVVSASHTINPNLYRSLPYNTLRDFEAVSCLVSGPALLVVNPEIGAQNVRELIALAKAKPGTLSFASSGNGSPPHLGGELFMAMAGISMVHIPYKGNGPAYNDLMGSQVSMMFPNIATVLPFVKAGKLKALAITSKTRSPIAPDIPTVSESGLAGYELNSWFGLLAPKGTAKKLTHQLQDDIARIYRDDTFRHQLLAQGVEPLANSPEEFELQIKKEIDYWANLFKTQHLQPEP